MAKCKETNPNVTDFKNPNSILKTLLNLFKISNVSLSQAMPSPLILASTARPGLSPSKIAARIIRRQAEAGIPVGPLPSGEISPDEIMEKIRIEEMINAITSEMVVDVAVKPGTVIQGTGGNAGGPVQVAGTVLGIASGNATAR
jgi:hypothetical protein